jgi:hypothetical protein
MRLNLHHDQAVGALALRAASERASHLGRVMIALGHKLPQLQ